MGDLSSVIEHLECTLEPSPKVKACHPLCSCDDCQKSLDEEGLNPSSHVTAFSRDDRGFTGEDSAQFLYPFLM